MRIKPVLLSLSALAAFAAGAAHANLIVNGNFEQTSYGSNKQLAANGLTAAFSGGTRSTLSGWTSSNGGDGGYNFVLNAATATTTSSALRLKGDSTGGIASPNGGNFFASDPLYYPGTLSQTISGLTVGTSYLLTFDYALAQQSGFNGPNSNDFWQVSFGNDVLTTAPLSSSDGSFSGWKSASMSFTASGVSEVLSFLAKGSSPGAPPFMLLDSVAMKAATTVPEPSTLSMLLGGVCVAGLLARRRRHNNDKHRQA
jgi:hypothetical protein